MKKKFLLSFVLALISIFALGAVCVSAMQYEDLKYDILYDGVTITGCDTSVTEVTIPEDIMGFPVTGISYEAFKDCTDLTSIAIPDSVTSIRAMAFLNCSSLTSITIPNNVTSIEDWTFCGCSSLASVTIPDTVTSIGEFAFEGCKDLTSITIPDSVTSINAGAFYNCTNIANVYIPDIESWCKIEFSNYDSNPLYYGGTLYHDQKRVTSLVIPDSITNLKDYTFYGCCSVTNVVMSKGIKSIGSSTFYGCNNLVGIVIPDGVTSIGKGAFSGCGSLINITIPEGVISIGERAFSDCCSLINAVIHDGVTSIGEGTFSGCGSLTSVTIPEGVISIGERTFSGCNNLVDVVIPDSVTSIGSYAFSDCSSLTDITIPDSVISIGKYAFSNCNSLTNVTIPDSVTSIGDNVFYNCAGLISLSVGRGVTTIPENAFYSCQNLKYVCLPKELLYIRNDAFNGCPKIEKVFYAGSEDEWNKILKYNRNENLTTKEIIYNAAKRTYKFDTGCDAAVSEITDYAVFVQPEAENGDKKLEGWYDNKNFSGSPVVFPYYGSAETLYAKWTDKTGLGFDDAFTAEANREYTVTTTDVGQTIYYEFVPRFTGEYRFFSKGNLDTYGCLYNSDRKLLVSDNNSGEGNNFKIAYNLTAGEKYYIAVNCLSGYGQFTLATETDCVESTKTVCVTATTGEKIFITIPKYLPQNARIILACYKGEKFVEMKSAPNTDETVYFIVNTDFDFAKVMVWDSIGTMIPVCRAEDVDKIS